MSKAFCPDLRVRIPEVMAEGLSHRLAAAHLGVSAAEFSHWRGRARVEGYQQNPGLWKREHPVS